ncbi:hypothetical protein KY290_036370 [Solanum tuberosum]|uniref:Uncharacterized protein n=1 Tax=Solanum tuberosum TaxID=4113 RepID=A0ABQ7TSZ9_SOLTU|nr:hypothetical protein KY285_035655 [Solanum tuberosum]KAH0737665.1 hypothetical protein KY290_036370 [Solanum tuberosum]
MNLEVDIWWRGWLEASVESVDCARVNEVTQLEELLHGAITVNVGEHTEGEGPAVMTRFEVTYGKKDLSKTT